MAGTPAHGNADCQPQVETLNILCPQTDFPGSLGSWGWADGDYHAGVYDGFRRDVTPLSRMAQQVSFLYVYVSGSWLSRVLRDGVHPVPKRGNAGSAREALRTQMCTGRYNFHNHDADSSLCAKEYSTPLPPPPLSLTNPGSRRR